MNEHRCVGCRSGLCEVPDASLCDDCQQGVSHECGDECRHRSDCALHNEPATPNGPCNCHLAREAPREGGVVGAVLRELEWRHWSTRDGDGRMCLICERDEPKGHAPECRMAAALTAAPRAGDDFRAGYAQAQSDAMRGCKCEGTKRLSLTVYKGNGREQEVIDCRFCELIPPMFERGAAAIEAARGEG